MEASMEALIDRFQACFVAAFRRSTANVDWFAKFGITRPQFYIMDTLQREGICKVTHLAEQMEVKPSAVTVMIDRLVAHGHVIRLLDDNDRRVVLLQLTEKGTETLKQAKALQREIVSERLTRIDRAELERFLDTFEAIIL